MGEGVSAAAFDAGQHQAHGEGVRARPRPRPIVDVTYMALLYNPVSHRLQSVTMLVGYAGRSAHRR